MCLVFFLLGLAYYTYSTRSVKDAKLRDFKFDNDCSRIIGFFHPNCDAGAGGEKVLWSAVAAI